MNSESFFEKLKKGMGAEIPQETEKGMKEKELIKKEKQNRVKNPSPSSNLKESSKKPQKIEMKTIPVENATKKELKEEPEKAETTKSKEKWFEPEGQLAVDVYQTEEELVIQSAIAGIKPEEIDILIEGDVITLRGRREKPLNEQGDYFTQECYWGPFSREIILPVEIDPGHITATMKEGILIIRMPKILRDKKRKIAVKQSK